MAVSMEGITLEAQKRIADIMDFIESYIQGNKFPPSQATIGDHFNKTQGWASHELRRMERLGLVVRHGMRGLEIVGRPLNSIRVNTVVVLHSKAGFQLTNTGIPFLVDKRVLLGIDIQNFEHWVYVVEMDVEPDIIEAGVRRADALIMRTALAGDPGDVVLYQGEGTLALGVVPEDDWEVTIVGKVVSILREEKVKNGKS